MYMTDYRITMDMTPEKILEEHDDCHHFVKEAAMIYQDEKSVLITHHMPNHDFITEFWRTHGGYSNAFFAANVEWHWLNMFDLVICGHTHDSNEFTRNGTRCVINPKGYGHENKYGFDPYKVVYL